MTARTMTTPAMTALVLMLIAVSACTGGQAGSSGVEAIESDVETAAEAGDPERGERTFQQCYACHSVDPEEIDLPGPNLAGVLGRRAGTWAQFAYSPAMRAAGSERGLVWTRETLDAFLADPQRFMPGTSMAYAGLREPSVRADVI
ncbi:MAG TPA: c-type cytochrome, partial [Hyphomicrobiaceae bacterium]